MEDISKERLENMLLKTDAVGMTVCSDIDFIPYNNISKTIKEIDSDIPQIIGGPHCTFVQQESLKDIPLANISVIGEGEHVILDRRGKLLEMGSMTRSVRGMTSERRRMWLLSNSNK